MYDCPCKNGGSCKECKVKDCKDTPVCFCPPEWTGKYCETKSVVPDNPSYGPWSNWNLSSCDGNAGKTRYRERYCRNSLGPKDPRCCRGRRFACKIEFAENDKVPTDRESEQCAADAYWAQWSPWSARCTKKNEGRNIFRKRKCINGRAGKTPGCKNTIPLRRQTKRCGKP